MIIKLRNKVPKIQDLVREKMIVKTKKQKVQAMAKADQLLRSPKMMNYHKKKKKD